MLALSRSATLATWRFRNSPWHLGQDNLLTILFSADSLTLQCRDYDTYRYTVTLTLGLWQQRTSLRLVPKVTTVTMIRVIHPHHNATRRWRASVSNLRWKKTHWKRYQITDAGPNRRHKLSLTDTGHWLRQRQVQWPQHFNCHASFPASFATELHEEAYWKHLPALFFIFTAVFRAFEVILQLSYTCVKAFSRGGKRYSAKHRSGNFHRWNASRMRRTNTCASTPISASALHEFEPTSVSNMAALAFAGWLAALLWK